jgi:pyruvate formate lyase activating enzyme
MIGCSECRRRVPNISRTLGVCVDCIRAAGPHLLTRLDVIHAQERRARALPARPPTTPGGELCQTCVNQCSIGEGQRGYCGVRHNRGRRLVGGGPEGAFVSWYHAPLPTNCVATWVCAGGTGAGYPQYAHSEGPEHGYQNLAVSYGACSFDCLFCQNWYHRAKAGAMPERRAEDLVADVRPRTSCICFFGGDPTPQLPHAFRVAELARTKMAGRVLRVCWETNGSMAPTLLNRMMDMSLESGGCVKIDLKAFDRNVHRALCGVDNARTLANFRTAAGRIRERPDPPPLVASTLLVPGYVGVREVANIASFIADLDPTIPYALLAFKGEYLMKDLPNTSRAEAQMCLQAARQAGLTRLHVGNANLLTT